MAKRLIIISMILVVLLSVFSIFASAAEVDINTLAYNNGSNMVQYNYDVGSTVNIMGTDYTFNDTGVVTIEVENIFTNYADIGFIDIPTDVTTFYLQLNFEWVTGDPYNIGIEYFQCFVTINGDALTTTSYDMMGYTSIFVPIHPGDRVEFGFTIDNFSNSFSGDFSFLLTARPTLRDVFEPVSSLPIVWLYNNASGGTGGGSYDEGYRVGYENGYDTGYGTGYDIGVADTNQKLNALKTDLFKNATYTAICRYEDTDTNVSVSITPDFTSDGIYFQTAYDQISAAIESDLSILDRVLIEITWANDKAFDYIATPIFVSGDSLVQSGDIYTVFGYSYTVSAEQETGTRPLVIQEVVNGSVIVNKFSLHVGRPEDLLKAFSLYSTSKAYNDGYSVGYGNGFDDGEDEGYTNGRNVGYKNGFIDGKAEGSANAENGTWRELVGAVIDAPINAFRSLFNFEILGLDMRLAIGSLLTIVVLLIIIKKLVL